ncbi:MAG: hypothetical protein EPO65_00830 [Dehalococcoidia bacterium]|nr:MAG: hypothetical protein EPO65_00830 [Dehalococcoidia bacterium]
MVSLLRLFPLRTVLFPGMPLPIQIFEPRYHQLLAECLEADEPFGVVLIRSGGEVGDAEVVPHDIGTTARIVSASPVGGGRVMVQTKGERRFRILTLNHDRPFLTADVEYPVDEVSEVPEALLEEVSKAFQQVQRFRQLVDGVYQRTVRVPEAPGALADAVGAAAADVLPPRLLQPLLESLDVRRRLERADAVLEPLIRGAHQQAQRAVSERWGGVDRRN